MTSILCVPGLFAVLVDQVASWEVQDVGTSENRYPLISNLWGKTFGWKSPNSPLALLLFSLPGMSSAGVYVAIFNESVNQGIYKHWAMFVDGPTKTVLNALGSSTRYYFDTSTADPRASPDLLELIHMSDVSIRNISTIQQIAESLPIRNEYPGYNCQDYVLELLDELEVKQIIDGTNMIYKGKKMELAKQQDGLA